MREVCVIGAGVIGLTSAWYLAEAGWRVRLIEKAATVGSGTSYMNGGQLSYRYVSPLADAGVPRKALKWLMDRDGPLRFKPTASLDQWLWLARFITHCHQAANRRTTLKLARLGDYSRTCMNELITQHGIPEFGWRESGKLVLYRSRPAFDHAARHIARDDIQQVMTPDLCLSHEPAIEALHEFLAGGIFTPGEAVADCHAFCHAMLGKLHQHPNFAGITQGEALRFQRLPNRRLRLVTADGVIDSEMFVLAAGTASRRLGATIGLRLPISPLKGYSLNVPFGATNLPPQVSVTDFERKVLYARIDGHLRISAMVDMVGDDTRIDPQRIDSLLRIARRDMPRAGQYEQAEQWAGLRPATPSGAPLIGASKVPGLWLNVGHGALGFTFACGSANLLANMMTNGSAPRNMDGTTWLD